MNFIWRRRRRRRSSIEYSTKVSSPSWL